MTVEQRLDQLEKRNKRLAVALMMMAMAAITIPPSAWMRRELFFGRYDRPHIV
ncbi:hypothetical protein OAF45_00070 [Candidatus Latescibacteria bacterium]|nr:hypothetical protein [Candidatus Latescibacterota bacterium]